MDKDPLSTERDFRRALEDSARARRAARRGRARPWLGWLGALGAAVAVRWRLALTLVMLLGFGSVFLVIFGLSVRWTEVYACSLAEARRSPAVVAELGEPVAPGLFAWSGSYIREGSVTDASFRTALAGPKGEGTLRVSWYSSPVGSSLRMELEKGGRTQVVYSGPARCGATD